MARKKKSKGTELSVFKGREAKLNQAIFQILSTNDPQTISELQKKANKYRGLRRTYYASVSKRIRHLEEAGYIKKAKLTREDSMASTYELRPKAYLAMLLKELSPEELLDLTTDSSASILSIAITNIILQL